MQDKGFKYIRTIEHPNSSISIILENKHRIIDIHFLLEWIKGKGHVISSNALIIIKDKRSNQNKNYKYCTIDSNNNIPKKYSLIVMKYIMNFYYKGDVVK